MLFGVRVAMIAAAGALGTVARYAVGVWVGIQSFPWATLAINTMGSFALGVVLVAGPSRLPRDLVVAVSVGFLGGFTTFSTFGYESQTLIRAGRPGASVAYMAASVAAGVAAAALGYTAGGALRR
jgi:CrcB protein